MEAKELRIGNLVEFAGSVYRVNHGTFSILDREKNKHNYKPIPLTEEWLLKFGWVWNKECDSYEKYPNGDARMHLRKINVNNSYTMFNYVLRAGIAERIFYVHQLQNLYFALTSKELEI